MRNDEEYGAHISSPLKNLFDLSRTIVFGDGPREPLLFRQSLAVHRTDSDSDSASSTSPICPPDSGTSHDSPDRARVYSVLNRIPRLITIAQFGGNVWPQWKFRYLFACYQPPTPESSGLKPVTGYCRGKPAEECGRAALAGYRQVNAAAHALH